MDMTKYVTIFIEESREHLQSLNEKLLQFESDQSNTVVLDGIFRSAHTLKGMSATMGYNQMAELTHQLENVLQKLRTGELKLNSNIIDILFKCIDQLEKMVDNIASGGEGNYQNPDVLQLLNSISNERTPENILNNTAKALQEHKETESLVDFNEFESNLILEGRNKGYNAYKITAYIRPSCIMKSARSYMIFKNLDPLGEVIKTIPSVQDIEDEKYENSFEIIFLSAKGADKIRQALVSIAEVDEPRIAQIEVQKEQITPAQIVSADGKSELEVPPPKAVPSHLVRVDIDRLDSLMNLVGELVINKTRLEQIAKHNPTPELNEALEQTDRLTSDLQNIVMKVRMVPIEQVFNRFPRMIRDLARELGKDINIFINGKETELDRTVIDEIGDPLVHILRNSIDHGIEPPVERKSKGKPENGSITLIAKHEGNNVIIEVDDDGRGIDPEQIRRKIIEKKIMPEAEARQLEDGEAINYIFYPGFSTAEKITDISGRGVGLDAVKNKIEALSGEINIKSTVGEGTKFIIQLPLTLAIIQALLVQVSNEIYAIPLSFIVETTFITDEQIKLVQDQEVMLLRGTVLPLIHLHELYQVPRQPLENEEISIVVVKKGDKKVGLIVDFLLGQQEIVIKSLGGELDSIPAVAGATILGNGLVSLIVDVTSLF